MERTAGHLEVLLEGILRAPEQPISELPLLTTAERHQMLVEWNDTITEYPKDQCIHQLFEDQVERTPEAVAVIFKESLLTYRELNERANQLAYHLRALGVGPGTLVGVCLERSLEMVIGLLGTLKAGGAYVPLDPAYPKDRLAFMLEDAQAPVCVTQEWLMADLPLPDTQVVCLDRDWPAISSLSTSNLAIEVRPDNLAYAIYTSGSTGTPKGVLIPHQGLLNLVFWHQRAFHVTAHDRATQLASLAFDAAVWEIWPYLSIGARLYLVQPEIVSSPRQLQDWLLAQAITITFVPTPIAEQLLDLEWSSASELRLLLTGGDKLHKSPTRSLPFQVVNNYGPTENSVVATSVALRSESNVVPPIGRPIDNVQVYILDPSCQPVPIGVAGELCIGGDSLASGYHNQPALTEEKFIAHPFSDVPGARLYQTGDLARYLPDGNIEFLGRVDDQVKLRGFRIELGEIEAVLSQHPRVHEAVVTVREDQPGDKRLAAYIASDPSAFPVVPSELVSEVRRFLEEKLPSYMVPAAFVLLESFPLTPNGKVDRRVLPAPSASDRYVAEEFIAPATPIEEIVASIWCEELGLERVSTDEDFFELGGHSLLAVQVISRIGETFSVNLPLQSLLERRTVHDLAERIVATAESGAM